MIRRRPALSLFFLVFFGFVVSKDLIGTKKASTKNEADEVEDKEKEIISAQKSQQLGAPGAAGGSGGTNASTQN